MIGPGSGNGRSCKWSQKPSKYINSGDEFYCVSTNIEEIFLELNDNVSFQQKIWTSSSCDSTISIQVHVLSRLSCILFAAAAELLDIVAFAKWAMCAGNPPRCLWAVAQYLSRCTVVKYLIWVSLCPAEYLLYTAPLSGVAAYWQRKQAVCPN